MLQSVRAKLMKWVSACCALWKEAVDTACTALTLPLTLPKSSAGEWKHTVFDTPLTAYKAGTQEIVKRSITHARQPDQKLQLHSLMPQLPQVIRPTMTSVHNKGNQLMSYSDDGTKRTY